MSYLKAKADSLYKSLKAERERLVKKYEAGGFIRYDVACGLTDPASATDFSAQGAITTVNITQYREDGTVVKNLTGGNVTRAVLDFNAIKTRNLAVCASGTMRDAFAARAAGKTVLLYSNDRALAWGGIILADTPCMLRVMNDINTFHGSIAPTISASSNPLPAGATGYDANSTGLVHAIPGKVEFQVLSHRGQFKPHNYRGDGDWLSNPVSIWSISDKSGLSINTFGINSLIRFWGNDQVLDLNGKTVDVHERPNLFAGFSAVVDLADSHFASLSTRGAKNAHIYSSVGLGRLGRNNHFAIRGHFVEKLLVEGIQSGDKSAKNKGSYFGTAIFNDSSEIVFKDVHQEHLNHQVARSSLGLSWYADLTMSELLFGKLTAGSSVWGNTTGNQRILGTTNVFPWMKWMPNVLAQQGIYQNYKETPYPVLKSNVELYNDVAQPKGGSLADADRLYNYLKSAQEAYRAGLKNADDTYLQVNIGHGVGLFDSLTITGNKVLRRDQMARSTNLVVANPMNNAEASQYPDSVSYGFRAGSTPEGVHNLAASRGSTCNDVYVMDCSFEGMALSMMEAVSIASDNFGLFKSFNGQAIRPFGYSNNRNPAAGVAASAMLLSKDKMVEVFGKTKNLAPASAPYMDAALDTAKIAFNNSSNAASWGTAGNVSGCYKGHDVIETSLATVTAIAALNKYLPTNAQLNGINNTNMDIGILAWRQSMMNALGAASANHVGLYGGYKGNINDNDNAPANVKNDGELYPWFVSASVTGPARLDNTQAPSTIVDKDAEFIAANIADPVNRLRTNLTTGYLACELPPCSDAIYKFKIELEDADNVNGGAKLRLVTAQSETPVTYADCAALLGFDSVGTNKADPAAQVVYHCVENLDGQNHVHKGSFGVRFDQVTDCAAIRCRVKGAENGSFAPEVNLIASRDVAQANDITDPQRPGSHVNDFHGCSVNGVTNCYIEDFEVDGAEGLGDIYGIEIQGESANVEVNKAIFKNMHAGQVYDATPAKDNFALSNKVGRYYNYGPQKCFGVRTSQNTTNVTVNDVQTYNLTSPAPELIKPVCLENQ